MASLAHTQYRWTELIQISDMFGAYGVSFVIVLVGACLARMLPCDADALGLVAAGAAGGGRWRRCSLMGHCRTSEQTTRAGPKVALIQGSIDIEMKYDPAQGQQIFDEYFDLSRQAVEEHADLDLIVWPETMFRDPWFTFAEDYRAAGRRPLDAGRDRSPQPPASTAPWCRWASPCLLGIDTVHYTATERRAFQHGAVRRSPGHGCWAATTSATWCPSASTCRWPRRFPGSIA